MTNPSRALADFVSYAGVALMVIGIVLPLLRPHLLIAWRSLSALLSQAPSAWACPNGCSTMTNGLPDRPQHALGSLPNCHSAATADDHPHDERNRSPPEHASSPAAIPSGRGVSIPELRAWRRNTRPPLFRRTEETAPARRTR